MEESFAIRINPQEVSKYNAKWSDVLLIITFIFASFSFPKTQNIDFFCNPEKFLTEWRRNPPLTLLYNQVIPESR